MKVYLYTATAILLWSTVASAFELTLEELDVIQLLFYASLFSLLALAAILGRRYRRRPFPRPLKRELLRSALLGLINPTLYYVVLFRAYDLLPAQEAQPLNWTWPITLSLLSVPLLKQRLSGYQLIGIAISFSGVLVIASKGDLHSLHFTHLGGDMLAVGSSLLWALFWIFNLQDRRDPVIKLFYCFLFGSGYNLIMLIFFSTPIPPSLKGWGGALYVGLFEMGITFVVWLKALSLAKNSASVSIAAYTTPFISLIFIHFIVGESILPSSMIGLLLIVGGILLSTVKKR